MILRYLSLTILGIIMTITNVIFAPIIALFVKGGYLPNWLAFFSVRKHLFREYVRGGGRYFKSLTECLGCYANNSSPLTDRQYFSIMSYLPCFSRVIGLLKRGSPSAIVWAIPLGIINSVKRLVFLPVAHISEKSTEVIHPLVADCYSATAVPRKVFTTRVCAAVFHTLPRLVFKSKTHHVFGMYVSAIAPTRGCTSVSKSSPQHSYVFPAVTNTIPSGNAQRGIFSPANNFKSAILFISFILKHHALLLCGYKKEYNT